MKTSLFRVAVSTLTFSFAAAVSAQASLIAYEGFDYASTPPGTDGNLTASGGIEGLNGGFGFDGAWDEFASTSTFGTGNRATGIAGPSDFASGNRVAPLSYTDGNSNVLPTTGNQARTSFGLRSVATRQLDGTYGNDGDTVWLSFLAQVFDTNAPNRWSGIALGDNGGYFGKPNNAANWGFAFNGASVADSGVESGTAVFFLARIDYNAGLDDITIWINPDLDSEPTIASGTSTSQNLGAFDEIILAGRYSADYDEIRIGTEFSSVVPEPATFASVFGLVVLGLALFRRARRRA